MLGRLLGRVLPHDRGLSMLRTAEVEQSGERGDPRMLFLGFFWMRLYRALGGHPPLLLAGSCSQPEYDADRPSEHEQ